MDEKLREAAWLAYVTLLRMPPVVRMKYQNVLIALRDSIAESLGATQEEVQNKAEEQVVELGGLI